MVCTAHGVENCDRKKCVRERTKREGGGRRPWWPPEGGVYDDDRPREGD